MFSGILTPDVVLYIAVASFGMFFVALTLMIFSAVEEENDPANKADANADRDDSGE